MLRILSLVLNSPLRHVALGQLTWLVDVYEVIDIQATQAQSGPQSQPRIDRSQRRSVERTACGWSRGIKSMSHDVHQPLSCLGNSSSQDCGVASDIARD